MATLQPSARSRSARSWRRLRGRPSTSRSPSFGGHHRTASRPCLLASSRMAPRWATAGGEGSEHTFASSGAARVQVNISLRRRPARPGYRPEAVHVKAIRLRFVAMRERLEEEPEPDEEPDETPAAVGTAPGTQVPSVADGGREHEYRTDLLTAAEVIDGKTLAGQLTKASGHGWDLVDIISAGDRYAVLLRRAKRPERNARPVGFTPPRS